MMILIVMVRFVMVSVGMMIEVFVFGSVLMFLCISEF